MTVVQNTAKCITRLPGMALGLAVTAAASGVGELQNTIANAHGCASAVRMFVCVNVEHVGLIVGGLTGKFDNAVNEALHTERSTDAESA